MIIKRRKRRTLLALGILHCCAVQSHQSPRLLGAEQAPNFQLRQKIGARFQPRVPDCRVQPRRISKNNNQDRFGNNTHQRPVTATSLVGSGRVGLGEGASQQPHRIDDSYQHPPARVPRGSRSILIFRHISKGLEPDCLVIAYSDTACHRASGL